MTLDSSPSAPLVAMLDQATSLPGRTQFDDRLAQAMADADRHGWTLAVISLDLDRFKVVDETNGHGAGDAVLPVLAERLMRNAGDEETVCRNGGEECLYPLINPSGREAVACMAGLAASRLKRMKQATATAHQRTVARRFDDAGAAPC